MEPKSLNAACGWTWIQSAWKLFIVNPGLWIVMFISYFAIAVVLSFIPVLGSLALALLSPVFGAGIMYAASEVEAKKELDLKFLFHGFQEKSKLNSLLVLGVISLVVSLVIGVMVFVFVGGTIMTIMMNGTEATVSNSVITGLGLGVVFWVLIIVVLQFLLLTALIFAVPLVMLNNIAPIAAVKFSFSACMKNIWPMLVYSVIALLLFVIAIIPMGLGFIILFPVMMISIYCMYRSIFSQGVSV